MSFSVACAHREPPVSVKPSKPGRTMGSSTPSQPAATSSSSSSASSPSPSAPQALCAAASFTHRPSCSIRLLKSSNDMPPPHGGRHPSQPRHGRNEGSSHRVRPSSLLARAVKRNGSPFSGIAAHRERMKRGRRSFSSTDNDGVRNTRLTTPRERTTTFNERTTKDGCSFERALKTAHFHRINTDHLLNAQLTRLRRPS